MTIETILTIMFLGQVLLIVVGMSLIMKLIQRLTKKLIEVLEILTDND